MEKLTEREEFLICSRAGCEIVGDGPVSETGFIKMKTKYPCAIFEEDGKYRVVQGEKK